MTARHGSLRAGGPLTVSTLKVENVVSAPQKPVPAMSLRRGSRFVLTLRAPKRKEPATLTVCVCVCVCVLG